MISGRAVTYTTCAYNLVSNVVIDWMAEAIPIIVRVSMIEVIVLAIIKNIRCIALLAL